LQDVEKGLQLRSRIAQSLNVPQRARFGFSLAAALLGGLFEHPGGWYGIACGMGTTFLQSHRASFSTAC